MGLQGVAARIQERDVGETVGGVIIQLHAKFRAHQHLARLQLEHIGDVVVLEGAGHPVLVMVDIQLGPVVAVQPVGRADPHILIAVFHE